MNNMLFDIYYKTSTNKPGIIKDVIKENVEQEIDELFKNESMFLVFVTKQNCNDIIFSHSVFGGTIVHEKDYKAPSAKKRGIEIMKFGRDGEIKVSSKYPRWEYGLFEYNDGELDIDELLANIK